MKPPKRPVKRRPTAPPTDWSGVADWYDNLVGESGSEYHQKVVLPGVLRLLAIEAGDPVIDVACGQGVLCRLLEQRRAEVTGVDAAEPLVEAARQRGPASIRYYAGDARDLSFLPQSSFVAAACVLAIQNIHPLAPVFTSVRRLLRPAGRFVVVMNHPCFRGAKETSWGWDEKRQIQYRRVDRYLLPRKSPIVTNPGSAPGAYTWTYHRALQDYVKSLRSAGLLVDAIEEWPSHKTSEPGTRQKAENTARKEIPLFMAIRAVVSPLPERPPTAPIV